MADSSGIEAIHHVPLLFECELLDRFLFFSPTKSYSEGEMMLAADWAAIVEVWPIVRGTVTV